MLQILEGSIVTGKSGKPLKVIGVDGDGLVLESDSGMLKAKRSAILKVLMPPPEPPEIQIGNQLKRNVQTQIKYPQKWFLKEVDDRSLSVPPIESATVERFSPSGYWVRTVAGTLYHVPESAIDDGTWELVNEYDQNN
jgi:hypothetical protein